MLVQHEDKFALFDVSVSIFVDGSVSWEGEVIVHKPSVLVQRAEVVLPDHVEATVVYIVLPYLDPVVLRVRW